MAKTILLIIPLLFILGSCSSNQPKIAPDNSLLPSAYVAQGLPAFDREWSSDDYSQAVIVLKRIAEKDSTSLPRRGSNQSGTVFARLVSLDNLQVVQSSPSLQQRLVLISGLMNNVSQITNVYVSVTSGERSFDAELVDLIGFTLQLSAETLQIADAFLASLPPDDPSHEARKEGQQTMRRGMALVVSGALTTITEHQIYRSSELIRLSDTIALILPDLYPYLPEVTQQEIPIRLQRIADKEQDRKLKESVMKIKISLSKSIKQGA